MITYDEFAKIEIRAGEIRDAQEVEGSEKLLRLTVYFGVNEEGHEDVRTVMSGIRKYVSPQELIGVRVAFVTNLAPRPIMGVESQAMILAATSESENGNYFSLWKFESTIPAGTKIK